MINPWNLVGWMIVGTVGGLALIALLENMREAFDEICRSKIGRGVLFSLIGIGFVALLRFMFGLWAVILLALFITMIFIFQKRNFIFGKEIED